MNVQNKATNADLNGTNTISNLVGGREPWSGGYRMRLVIEMS